MNEKILFVDDDSNILSAFKRFLRKDFLFETALSGHEGLQILQKKGPFAVVVADMRMPGMDGIEFLRHVKEQCPDTVRIMLTGNADMKTAIDAVNEGNIFRFLTKPASREIITKTLKASIEQYKLIIAERELLENTLHGSITVLTEILSMVNPVAFTHALRIKKYVRYIAEQLVLSDIWLFEIAAMLSQIGCVTIPSEILEKKLAGEELTEDENIMFSSHPAVAGKLLGNIPRIEDIAAMIEHQNNPPHISDTVNKNNHVTWGAQILYVALDLDKMLVSGESYRSAMGYLKKKNLNPEILTVLENYNEESEKQLVIKTVMVKELRTGMVIDIDIKTHNGVLVAPKGQEVTYPLLSRIRNFSQGVGVNEPIRVRFTVNS